jgi:hypothetical protein
MTTTGQHTFLPWLRRGVGTTIERADDDPTAAPRASLEVNLAVTGGSLSGPIDVKLALYGPGDIASLDQRVVIRTWPRPDVFQSEPNFFPLIELQPADLPWRFTPAAASGADRLRPWLTLIALADAEIASLMPASSDQPLSVLTVEGSASLPPLDQSWAWAHVQVTGAPSIDAAGALDLLDHDPSRILARIVCPRRLDPDTVYTAFLVPALERARLAGLRQAVPDGVDGLAPAWAPGQTNVALPVYYHWRFQTGDTGDFASLARRVVPRPMPPTIGSRAMDESHPGLALPAAAAAPLYAESALRALDSTSTAWSDADKSSWTTALETVLNRPAALLAAPGGEPAVAPPLYGQWYAAKTTVDSAANPSWWFADLNIDPRMRVGAGLGTVVIQNGQQQYLAGAWSQVDGIRAANAALRAAQLAREAALRLYDRHLTVRNDLSVLAYTTPLHARVLGSPQTIAAILAGTPLTCGVLRPAWRRLTRANGPVARRLALARTVTAPAILDRINGGSLRVAPPPALPTQLATFQRVGAATVQNWASPDVLSVVDKLSHLTLMEWIIVLIAAAILFAIGAGGIGIALALLAAALQLLHRPVVDLETRVALRDGTLTAAALTAAPKRPAFVPIELAVGGAAPAQPSLSSGSSEQPAAARFRTAAASVFGDFQTALLPGAVLRPASVATLRAKLTTALNPSTTIAAGIKGRLMLTTGVEWTFSDPLEPVMAAPSFEDPMYLPLSQVSNDWILAGLDDVPQDTVSLVQTNERFVEGYMVGVNHEMARTLLFNEYPTDQRGTYFRQFWDSRTAPAPQPDVTPIHTWGASSPLGGNSARTDPQAGTYLVLLLRAELLRRYPNLVVYATKAKWNDAGGHDVDDTTELQPVFSGRLGSGVGFWGFDLSVATAKGAGKAPGDAGYFFMLQEAPTEPRLGLEPATTYGAAVTDWPHMSWGALAPDASTLSAMTFVDLGATLPDTASVSDPGHAVWHASEGSRASDLAYITYRVPVRVAIHAGRMIP